MPKRNLVRNVIHGDELLDRIAHGVDCIELVATSAYGNNSGNVLIESRYGEPTVSHDGITNVASLVLDDAISNAAVSIIRQASSKTDANAGDATTLTILLACCAYRYWSSRINDGSPIRKVQVEMSMAVSGIINLIDAHKITNPTMDDLRNVALVSAGSDSIAEGVIYAVEQAGDNGSVTVVEQLEPRIDVDVIKGLSFKSGLTAVALAKDLQSLKTVYDNPYVVVIPKQVTRNDDILPILDRLVRAGKRGIVLIADVSGQALETIVSNKLSGKLDIAVVAPLSNNRDEFINDVAFYCNTKPFTGRADEFDVDKDAGSIDNAYVTMNETVLNGTHAEGLDDYVANITDDKRRKMLTGKTSRISVGAATDVERHDLRLRVDDAVCAVRTAQSEGVCLGGGVELRNIASELGLDYLLTPYQILTGESLPPVRVELDENEVVSYRPKTDGIDTLTGKAGNMRELGILDSAKAIKEAVINAHSAASQLISITVALPFKEDME